MGRPTQAINYSSYQDRHTFLSQARMVISVPIVIYPRVNRLEYKLFLRSVNYPLTHSNHSVLHWYNLLFSCSSCLPTFSPSLGYCLFTWHIRSGCTIWNGYCQKCGYLHSCLHHCQYASLRCWHLRWHLCPVYWHDFKWLVCTPHRQMLSDGQDHLLDGGQGHSQ